MFSLMFKTIQNNKLVRFSLLGSKLSMGGHALPKSLEVSRMTKDQFEIVKKELISKLSSAIRIDFTNDLPEKTSFGDVDVLYYIDEEMKKCHIDSCASEAAKKSYRSGNYAANLVKELFEPISLVRNGDVFSFSFPAVTQNVCAQYHQIDMIKCRNYEHYQFMKFFLSYGDVGGILGKLAHHHGLKVGLDGLYMHVMSNTLAKYMRDKALACRSVGANDGVSNAVLAEEEQEVLLLECECDASEARTTTEGVILLTLDPRVACDYLGLSYDQWLGGFASNADIFAWIAASRYFSVDQFRHMNAANRKRVEKRPFYRSFVGHIGVDLSAIEDSRADQPTGVEAALSEDENQVSGDQMHAKSSSGGSSSGSGGSGVVRRPHSDSIVRSEHQLEAVRRFGKESEMDVLVQRCRERAASKALRAERMRLIALEGAGAECTDTVRQRKQNPDKCNNAAVDS